jgi:hypothetical protein
MATLWSPPCDSSRQRKPLRLCLRLRWFCHCPGVKWGRINGHNQKKVTSNPGWFRKGHAGGSRRTHGHASQYGGSLTYRSWVGLLARTSNPKNKYYWGVKVAARWDPKKGGSFENFLRDMGERPAGMSLGRILDLPDPGYCKSNCQFMDSKTQGAERRGRNAMMRLRMWKHLQKVCKRIREGKS